MSMRERFYQTDVIDAFQTLSFENSNNNPVEIEITNPSEYAIAKGENHHSVRLVIDKDEFTKIAEAWLKAQST